MKRQLAIRFGSILILLGAASQAWSAERVMFVTSVAGTGVLGNWPDAGHDTGVAAGDAVCQSLALTAGLANPDNFVAWISAFDADAYCRLHGLTGTKVGNCGQISLPRSAGPWLRTDGSPFAARILQMLGGSGQVFHPPRLDEFGDTVVSNLGTGTDVMGVFDSSSGNCQGWMSGAAGEWMGRGYSDRTTGGWTDVGSSSCSNPFRLLCLERLSGPSLPAFGESGRQAFITSIRGVGDLGGWSDAGGQTGLAAGDAICQARAAAGGLAFSSSFKAWLSTSSVDAKDLFVFDGPWMRLDGVRIADGIADLTDGVLRSSLNVTELGEYVGNLGLWTGTDSAGLALADTCSDWTTSSGAVSGDGGLAYATNVAWTTFSTPSTCDSNWLSLYCFSDIDPAIIFIFSDGFESGDTLEWSATLP